MLYDDFLLRLSAQQSTCARVSDCFPREFRTHSEPADAMDAAESEGEMTEKKIASVCVHVSSLGCLYSYEARTRRCLRFSSGVMTVS